MNPDSRNVDPLMDPAVRLENKQSRVLNEVVACGNKEKVAGKDLCKDVQ